MGQDNTFRIAGTATGIHNATDIFAGWLDRIHDIGLADNQQFLERNNMLNLFVEA